MSDNLKNISFDGWLSIVICLLLGILCTLQFIFRSFLNSPLAWTEESAGFLYVALVFFSTSYAIKEKTITRVEIIDTILSRLPKARRVMEIVSHGISFAFSLLIAYYSIEIVQKSFAINQTSSALALPMGGVYLITTITFVLMALRYLQRAVAELRAGAGAHGA